MPLELDYYYGNEAEQYSFYRIPKVLFTDSRFRGSPCCGPRPALPRRYLAQIRRNIRQGKRSPVNCCFLNWPLWDSWESPLCCSRKRGWG